MKARSLLVVALAAITLGSTTACAAGGAAGGSGSSQVLTASELESANTTNVYDAVDLLRPRWFRSRGQEPEVYMDGMRAGSLEYLRQLSVNQVAELRYHPIGVEAGRFNGNTTGVIEVIRPM